MCLIMKTELPSYRAGLKRRPGKLPFRLEQLSCSATGFLLHTCWLFFPLAAMVRSLRHLVREKATISPNELTTILWSRALMV